MKLCRTLALMVALGGLTGATITGVVAQDTKAKPKPADDKKAPAKDDKKTGKITYYEVKTGWRFKVVDGDDKTLAIAARSYEKKEDVLKDLEALKAVLNAAKPVETKE